MKTWLSMKGRAVLWLLVFSAVAEAQATSIQLVSGSDAGQPPAAGGNGDSSVPLLSPDGRFVLFASTANNLVLPTNGLPIPCLTPARLNVYLRDRSNATTVLASVNLTGAGGGNGDSLPAGLSQDGRYALFESSASDLVPGDNNNASDIFVRDLVNGVTLLVSISTNGVAGNGASRGAVLTPEGHYVAFVSAANNLVARDTNGIPDVFVRDLQSGVTTLASVGAIAPTSTSSSESPDITPDGRFLAFSSTATNLVPGMQTVGDIYVRDLVAGTTYWASAYARTALLNVRGTTNALSFNHALSADGRFVAYVTTRSPLSASAATGIILRYDLQTGLTDLVHTNAALPTTAAAEDIRNLDMTPDGRVIAFVANTNGTSGSTTCLLAWDGNSGTTSLASVDGSNAVPANTICDWPALDASGHYVAFLSDAPNLVTNALVGTYHLYVRDLQAGTTMLVDADTNAVGSLLTCATAPRLSANARFVAFEGPDGQLVTSDRNGCLDVFVRDLTIRSNELVSVHGPGFASRVADGSSSASISSISTDGRYIAFASDADNLNGTTDANGFPDIFVRDLATGSNLLVSADTGGLPGNGLSAEASISGDGQYVAFSSSASNLVAGDTNKAQDVFVRNLQTGTTRLVSKRADGNGAGNAASYSPVLSTDGRFVMFRSQATDLASGSFTGTENLFVGNLATGTIDALTVRGLSAAVMTPDGRFVAFVGILANLSTAYLYVWDCQSRARVYTNLTTGITSLGISADGNRLAYASSTYIYAADRAARTSWSISALPPPSLNPRLNADGRWLAYVKRVGTTNHVYLYDFIARTEHLVSHGNHSTNPAQGRSDSPDISPDGRFVAYRSLASNLVASDTNGVSDVVLYDRLTDANTLLSANCSSGASANSISFAPVFSRDGQTLLFRTWSSDILAQDFSRSGHVLAYSFLTAVILPPATPGQGPWISWPFVPGDTYHVQFKNRLTDTDWQDVPGSISNQGVKAYLQDLASPGAQRFYRISAF